MLSSLLWIGLVIIVVVRRCSGLEVCTSKVGLHCELVMCCAGFVGFVVCSCCSGKSKCQSDYLGFSSVVCLVCALSGSVCWLACGLEFPSVDSLCLL